ncbi:MAG TPA: AAA family ATPase [Polyangium sp.]|nr:AAA family ATPase [Polyangium sp.]
MSQLTIEAKDFRVLEHMKWSPSGVCLLCGPNGAGKTTTLRVFKFLRMLFERGHEAAFAAVQGQFFKRIGSAAEAPVVFDVSLGDIRWTTRFPMSAKGSKGTYGEELRFKNEVVLRAEMFDEGFYHGSERRAHDEVRCGAKWLWDRGESEWMRPLVNLLGGTRIYESYWMNQIIGYPEYDPRAAYLAGNGRNLWSVLANWKQSPIRFRDQYDWVMSVARQAFPDLISALEFDRGLAVIYPPGIVESDDGLPPALMAEGLLTGLLHLTAIAGAREGSILCFDEVENQLHPHAIRSLIHAMREQAEQKNLTIVLTTHSPVVLNAFRDEPEQVYVLDKSNSSGYVPVPMSDLHSEEWLAQAKLGTLYEHLAFASPRVESKP